MSSLNYIFLGKSNAKTKEKILKIKEDNKISNENFFYYEEEILVSDVLFQLNNTSLFLEKQMIIYETLNLEPFMSYLKEPCLDKILILISNKLPKNFTPDLAEVIEINEFNFTELVSYVNKFFKTKEIDISDDIVVEIIKRCNEDYFTIKKELEKILIYLNTDIKKVDYLLIDNLVPINIEDNAFSIIDAILTRDKAKMFKIYNDLLAKNQDPIQILNVLQNKFNEIFYTKVLLDFKKTNEEIKSYFNYSKGRTYYTIKTAKSFDIKSVKYFINALFDLEYKIKSGQLEKNIGLELFLLEMR